jgi:hypothetical protein
MKLFTRLMFALMAILSIYIGFVIHDMSNLQTWRKIALYITIEFPFFASLYLIFRKIIKI